MRAIEGGEEAPAHPPAHASPACARARAQVLTNACPLSYFVRARGEHRQQPAAAAA